MSALQFAAGWNQSKTLPGCQGRQINRVPSCVHIRNGFLEGSARLDTFRPCPSSAQASPSTRHRPNTWAAFGVQKAWSDNDQQQQNQTSLQVPTISFEEAVPNRISLIGKVASEPELIWEDDGTAVTSTWLDVKRWPGEENDRFYLEINGQGEEESLPEIVCNNIVAGDQVLVEGQLIIRQVKEGETEVPVPVVQVEDFKKVERGSYSRTSSTSTSSAYGASFSQLSTEEEWRNLFSHPEQYWDNRENKISVRSPDFKHKSTKAALWLSDKQLPGWVLSRLPELSHGVQSTRSRQGSQDSSQPTSKSWGDDTAWG